MHQKYNITVNPNATDDSVIATICQYVYDAHAQWGQQFVSLYDSQRFTTYPHIELSTNRVLRIGYISADFFTHSVSYFIEAPLAHADKSRVHVVCYSNVARKDGQVHLQSLVQTWRNIHDMNTQAVCRAHTTGQH